MAPTLGPIVDPNLLMDFAVGGALRWDNLRVTQNEVVDDSGIAYAKWYFLVDFNEQFRLLVLGELNGVRFVVFERKAVIAVTWEEENKLLVIDSVRQVAFSFQELGYLSRSYVRVR